MNAHNKEYIFCIGWNRTGTRTFKECLNVLEIKCSHWEPTKHLCAEWAYKNWNEFGAFITTHDYEAYSDAPWCFPGLYKRLDKFFPNAKFVLTIRDESRWVNSYKNLYEKHFEGHSGFLEIPILKNNKEYGWVHPLIFKGRKIITGNEEIYKNIFNKHNNEVISCFKDRPSKLLVINWEEGGASWSKICKFLNKDIPNKEFPWKRDSRKLYEK